MNKQSKTEVTTIKPIRVILPFLFILSAFIIAFDSIWIGLLLTVIIDWILLSYIAVIFVLREKEFIIRFPFRLFNRSIHLSDFDKNYKMTLLRSLHGPFKFPTIKFEYSGSKRTISFLRPPDFEFTLLENYLQENFNAKIFEKG